MISPRNENSAFELLASEVSLYFHQALQMLKTSQEMSESSSPLVEYYGYLQCVKGIILMELNPNQELFFSYHGISYDKEKHKMRIHILLELLNHLEYYQPYYCEGK
ncbi:unnamed protein product [marine sediment metagenome]|uniref:Uncharacterized protein n=1 Tax=marine sediment metagenome TaxID=412755 RepID=X1TER1_9ZZZZ